MEEMTKYFDGGGQQHTEEALRIAKEYADANGIKSIVVASTTGATAKKAAEVFKGKDLVVVTHVYGFREADKIEFEEGLREKLEAKGAKVLTSAHGFGGVNRLAESAPGNIIANTLRMFSQGVKVAIEIAGQAADAGYVRTDEDILSIAGTGRGADTVLVLQPANLRRLFDMHVKRILAMPV